MTMQKRDGWFLDYAASRNLTERTRHFVQSDFAAASVLDIGCNEGQMTAQALAWGARSAYGIDFDKVAIEKARAKAIPGATFSVEDADCSACWRSVPRADVVLLLSVYLTRELEGPKEAILANAAAKAYRCLYFEGHANKTQGYGPEQYVADIAAYTDFENIEYLGDTDAPGCRPLIRCWREPLGAHLAMDWISWAMSKYSKIVVVGKSAVGKSVIAKQLADQWASLNTQHAIYDDVPPPYNYDKFVLFDWRGLEYVPDAQCVFIVTCDEAERQRRIDGQPYKDRLLRTAPGVIKNAKAVFTVQT